MDKRKSFHFQTVIGLFIAAVVFFMTFINTSEFRKDYGEGAAENNYRILDSIVAHIEYGVHYGKRLDNYYDIEQIFLDLETYCETDQYFISDPEGSLLYGKEIPGWFRDEFARLSMGGEDYSMPTHNGERGILTKILDGEDIIGYAGIFYHEAGANQVTERYVQWMYLFAGLLALGGVLAFLLLFRFAPHGFQASRLTRMILPLVAVLNLLAVGNSYLVLRNGYTAIAGEMAEKLLEKNADDLERLVESGVNYGDISRPEDYFAGIAEKAAQIESIGLGDGPLEGYVCRELPADGTGEKKYLQVKASEAYIDGRVNSAVVNVAVAAVTELMIASELLVFLVGLLVKPHDSRKKRLKANGKQSVEYIEVVRGLSFFFAAFRYMSVAFMTVVLAQIYKPVIVFGHEIPYEIVMGFPLSAQIFISMITSYISGAVTDKRGWKNVTLFGVTIMCAGTLLSAFSSEPVAFILAQMVVGVGLGFAKMGIDFYAVAVASEEDMSAYTAGANASIIVGFSSSSLIGALLADTFGYSGAYLAMTAVGVFVFFLVLFFGQDVIQKKEKEAKLPDTEAASGWDLRFGAYILCIILPYFFIMMFVDYFFPVYAVEQGATLDEVGYVMLLYGMATAYIGARICDKLMKKLPPKVLMVGVMFLLAAAIFLFAVKNYVLFAALIVLLIGVADGIMPSAQFDYLYHLPLSKKLGFSKALGVEGFFSNLIGAAAPMVFSLVMLYGNGGLVIVAVIVSVCALLFSLANGGKGAFKKGVGTLLVCGLLGSLFPGNSVYAREDQEKIRIGYCQAESYYEFDYQLYDILAGLAKRGDIAVDAGGLYEGSEARQVWDRLSEAESDSYIFVKEAFIDYSRGEYADFSEAETAARIRSVVAENDVDLMLTMGTSAGRMLMNCSTVDYMNFLASDPVGAGIVNGDEYSETERGWAHVNSGVDERALEVMEDLFSPESLGVVYNFEDPDAYLYSAAKSVDAYGEREGVRVLKAHVSDEIEDTQEAYEQYVAEMKAAHEELAAQGVDVYILTTSLLEPEDFNAVLEPLVEKGIPIFTVNSTEDVRYGATAAIEMLDYPNIGRFAAEVLSEYAKGRSLSELTQKYDTAPFLVLNMDTLRRSGLTLPLDVLLSASSIYGAYAGETR